MGSFLPELISEISPNVLTMIVPPESEAFARAIGAAPRIHRLKAGSPALRLFDQTVVRSTARNHDIILSPMNHGPIRSSVPQVLWACNALYFEPPKSLTDRVQIRLALQAMSHANLTIFPSESTRTSALDVGFNGRSAVLPHPLRVPDAPTWRSSVSGKPLQILVPATANPHKNLGILSQISDQLSVRGERHEISVTAHVPPHRSSLGGVSPIDRYEQESFHSFSQDYDLVLLTSLVESFSYPLLESIVAGLPVAASVIPVHAEVARGRAKLFHPDQPAEAASAIIRARDEWTPLTTEEFRQIADRHSPARYAKATSELIHEVLQGEQC